MRSYITGGTVCYGHGRVYVVRSHTIGGTICYEHQRVHFVRSHITGGTIDTGIGLYILRDLTSQGVRFVTGIGVCML